MQFSGVDQIEGELQMSNNIDFISLFLENKQRISYRPQLNKITKSVVGSILLSQIVYWWQKSERRPFYKFAAPCKHNLYREGDSWQEELGFTRYELQTALKGIAKKITKGVSLKESEKKYLVIYWTDKNRLTWYKLNEVVFSSHIASLCNVGYQHYICNAGSQHYISNAGYQNYISNAGSQHYLYGTETNTENTTHTTSDKYFGVCIFLFSKQPYSYSKEEAESEANSLFAALKPDSWLELAKAIDRISYLSFQPDFSQRPKNPLGLLKKSGIKKGKCAIRVNGTYRESWLAKEIEKAKSRAKPKKEKAFDWSKVTEEQIDQTADKLDQFMKTQYQKHGLDSLAVRAAFEAILEGEV